MTKSDDKRVPTLRFKGFTDEWEQRKLGDVAKIVGGGTPSTNISNYWNGNINWYSPTEIGNQIFVNSSKKKITELGLKESSAKLLPGKKTILFTSRAGIGDMAIMKTDGSTNQGFQSWIVKPDIIDIYFLYSLGSKLKRQALRKASGSTFLEISNSEVKKLSLYLPDFEEQTIIGKIIKLIDKLIMLQQRKLKLLNKLKKGLINNILSSVLHFTSTKSVEHIVTFGDIFNYERPDNYIVSSENYVSSGIPVLTANKSFILGYSNENHPYNKGKAIIFDDFTLESKLVNFNFMVKSSAIKILTTKPSYDIDFCFVLLKNTPLIQEGHARHYISRVQPTKVKVPNLTLQRKYAKIFNTLEYKIRNSNSIQENLKLLKQFLLQNMFI